ncbi:MAG: rhomboid family intramembrane serine protease [Proteobacteria bacterium]|nr:rhomboid family intramembrane serine protease [Pseudomonadota bacterium]
MSVPPIPAQEDDAPVYGFSRYPVVFIVLALNALAYALLVITDGDFTISADTMLSFGALVPREAIEGEYWRLLSYGFLHFSPMHIAANSICLIAWGVPLEGWLGARRMALLYLASIVIAGIGSFLMQTGPTVTAGASGGVSGLLGALFVLYLMRIVRLPASFFLINIGLNIAVPFMVPGIDWQAHLSGFVGGALIMLVLLRLNVPREP